MKTTKKILLIAAALACTTALATPPRPAPIFLQNLTWPEVRDAVQAGKTTVIIPIGGTEQNGPHMALGKHNARAIEMSVRIARQLGGTLVAPVISYVPEGAIEPPTGHMKYPGTLSIPVDAFEKTLEGAARSLKAAGFKDIVFLGDHGGYRASLDKVAARLDHEWAANGARVHALPEYYRELPHAGRDDTSLTMALRNGVLVRKDRVAESATREGAAQDPAGANADQGATLSQEIVERSVAALKKAIARR